MPKSESAESLLKRLQKIERAQGRLTDITARIRKQADTLGEVLKTAQGFADEKPAARVRKPATARRTPVTARKSAGRRTAAPPAAGSMTTPRRSPRSSASV